MAAVLSASPATAPVARSPVITVRTPGHSATIEADITGAKDLFLVVTDGGDGFSCDWADWIEPKLVGPSGEKKLTEINWKAASSDWGTVGRNRNADGGPLKVAGQAVGSGIGTHANSVIHFELPSGYTKFVSKVGLDNGGSIRDRAAACSSWCIRRRRLLRSRKGGPRQPTNRPMRSHSLM